MSNSQGVIKMALRRLGRLGSGDTPSDQEYLDALPYIRNIYMTLINSGYLGKLKNVAIDSLSGEITLRPGHHILVDTDDMGSIILPETLVRDVVRDHDYGSGHSRDDRGGALTTPNDGAVCAVTNHRFNQTKYYIYDGVVKKWADLDYLKPTYEDPADMPAGMLTMLLSWPLPMVERDTVGFASLLAMKLADEYGLEASPTTVQMAREYQLSLGMSWGREGAHTTLEDDYREDWNPRDYQ